MTDDALVLLPEEREALYRELFSRTLDAILVADEHGRWVDANESALALLGYERDELLAAGAAGVIDAETGWLGDLVDRDGEWRGRLAVRRRDGSLVHAEGRAFVLRDAAPRLFAAILREPATLKPGSLVEAEFAAIVEGSYDAIFSKSLDGTIRSWNPGAQRIYGYTPDEVVGGHVSMLAPPDRKHEIDEILARLRRGEPVRDLRTKRVTRAGVEIDIWLSISPVRDANGDIVGAATIARDITDHVRIEAELRRAQDQLSIITRASADGITIQDSTGRLVYANDSAARLSGYPDAEAFLSAPIDEILGRFSMRDETGKPFAPDRLPGRRVLMGEPDAEAMLLVRDLRTGEDGWRLVRSSPLLDEEGGVRYVVNVFHDITALKRAEEQLRFQAEASRELMTSLDYESTISRIARMAVPTLADWCGVDLLEPDGSLRQLAVAHVDPAKIEWAREFRRRVGVDMTSPTGLAAVVRTGRPELYPYVSAEMADATPGMPEQLAAIRMVDVRSAMIVPLIARGRTLGAMTFVWSESGRTYDDADLRLAEDVATRAALALDNARLYRERDAIAKTLQQSLLPGPLPEIEHLELSARYRAAGDGIEVGGDFYDVFDAGNGAWAFAIGDVCGKGPRAATLMSAARQTVRTAAMRARRPSDVLRTLNTALGRHVEEPWFCTVCFASVRVEDGRARVTLCAGGHPLPIVIRADGSVGFVGRPGTLLGIFDDVELTDVTIDLARGETIVLYTDGVTDEQNDGVEFGEERLLEVVRANARASTDELADAIEAALRDFRPDEPADDVALLIARVGEAR